MAYNSVAESFSRAAAVPSRISRMRGENLPGWTNFDDVYSDIADATDIEEAFKPSKLVDRLPCIKDYSSRTQRQIIAVVVRDMCRLEAPEDGLVCVLRGSYRWVIRHEAAA